MHGFCPPPDIAKRIEDLTPAVERELDGDRRFFERRPRRSYRVRRGYMRETECFVIASPGQLSLQPSRALFVAVYQIEPGLRLRHPFTAPKNIETDLSEEEARAAFAFITGTADGPTFFEKWKAIARQTRKADQ